MLVSELEAGLLEEFPAHAAESWDRTGMLVGDPLAEVAGVTVALDPTIGAIRHAADRGDNVLVTHHPLFLDPPGRVTPSSRTADAAGSRIWEAVRAGVSVISFHTALDAHPRAAAVLAGPLGLDPGDELLDPLAGSPGFGYGRICDAGGASLGDLARRCADAFGKPNRVWGDAAKPVGRVCLWTGAAGTAPRACNARGMDLLVCGEVKYHEALDAHEAGLCIIELGHDVSEQVHCPVLVESVRRRGVPAGAIHPMDLPANWR